MLMVQPAGDLDNGRHSLDKDSIPDGVRFMLIPVRRPRFGRLLDWFVVAPLLFIFVGLGAYHYRRLDREQIDPERAKELASRKIEAAVSATTDWPQWRGPNRDGVSTESGLLAAWPKDGPPVLWEKPTGEGFGSVAVVKGRLFLLVQAGANEAVVCCDAETGKEHWRFEYPCQYRNDYGNGPRSTPSVDGECVYTVGATGLMHCLKAFTDQPKGELVWAKDLMQEFGAEIPKWGVSFSPLVDGERIYIMPGGPNGHSLAALDAKTGATIWKKHNDEASYSSPIAATIQGLKQILFFPGNRLISVSPDTGEKLWDYPWANENACNIATPIVLDDYVFISSSYARGCVMLKIDKDRGEWKPKRVYKNNRMRNHFSTSVRHQDYLYGFDDSTLACMDFRTGERMWDERGFDKGSVLIADGKLIVYGANGILALAQTNPDAYIEISRFQFSKAARSCWSVPVVANGRLYVRDQERLVCFDVKAASR
jgi:outer membrane protein assembly factor BamB